jgi:ribosome-associated heat shock protein Hsp15
MLNGELVKPSKEVKAGDEVSVKVIPIWRSYEVIDIPKSRVGAKLVNDYARETTAEEDLEELEKVRLMNKQNRESGIFGRPTKRNRRNLDRFKSS